MNEIRFENKYSARINVHRPNNIPENVWEYVCDRHVAQTLLVEEAVEESKNNGQNKLKVFVQSCFPRPTGAPYITITMTVHYPVTDIFSLAEAILKERVKIFLEYAEETKNEFNDLLFRLRKLNIVPDLIKILKDYERNIERLSQLEAKFSELISQKKSRSKTK